VISMKVVPDIKALDAVNLELELALAQRRKLQLMSEIHSRVNRSIAPICGWIEANGVLPESVNQRDFQLGRIKFAHLETYQKRILHHLFTPGRNGRLPYNRMFWSQIKKSGKCRASTDRMLLADGSWVAFSELAGKEFEVLGFDDRDGSIKKAKASAFSNGIQPCWKLVTETGKEITATGNHPFFTYRGWVKLEDLVSGQKIAVPTHHPVSSENLLSDNEVKLLAYLISEGSLNNALGFTQQAGVQLEEMREICAAFNCYLKPRPGKGWDGWTYSIASNSPLSPRKDHRNLILEIVRKHGLDNTLSGDKFIPAAIFRSCDEQIALFLNRLFSGDGWAAMDGQNIGYCSISKRLAEDVQLLLQRLGIHGILRAKIVAKSRTGFAYSVDIDDRYNVLKFAALVGIYGKEDALRSVVTRAENRYQKRAARIDVLDKALWPELIQACYDFTVFPTHFFGKGLAKTWAVTRERVGDVVDFLGREDLRRLVSSDVGWEEIKSISYVGEIPTVGIEVPEYHAYCSSVIEHNTQIAAWILAWAASEVESPNYFLVVANSKQQSAGRIFQAALPTLRALGHKVPMSLNSKPLIRCNNGTDVEVIANNFEDQSGAGYGGVFGSEIWSFVTERDIRLLEELPPIPTRNISFNFFETYAGFKNESKVLLDYFLRIFKDADEKEPTRKARPVPGLEDIVTLSNSGDMIPACWHIPDEGLFYFNDHERRMPWQLGEAGEQYYAGERASALRESTYIRLCENRWQDSEGGFLLQEWIERSISNDLPNKLAPMVIAIDASRGRRDCVAIVGVNQEFERYRTKFVRIEQPQGSDFDLDEIVGEQIWQLFCQGLIYRREALPSEKAFVDAGKTPIEVWYDPYQMHQVAINLREKRGLLVAEFSQHSERTMADTFLFQQYKDARIDNPDNKTLLAHLKNARAEDVGENANQMRIRKGKGSHIAEDGAVAQSMAVWRCSKRKPAARVGFLLQAQVKSGWGFKE